MQLEGQWERWALINDLFPSQTTPVMISLGRPNLLLSYPPDERRIKANQGKNNGKYC